MSSLKAQESYVKKNQDGAGDFVDTVSIMQNWCGRRAPISPPPRNNAMAPHTPAAHRRKNHVRAEETQAAGWEGQYGYLADMYKEVRPPGADRHPHGADGRGSWRRSSRRCLPTRRTAAALAPA